MILYVVLIEWLQLKPQRKADVYVEIFENRNRAESYAEEEYKKFIKNRDKHFGKEVTNTKNKLSWHNTETGAYFTYEIFEKELEIPGNICSN